MNIEKMYSTIDTHVVGEPFRIVLQSPIQFLGSSLVEKQAALQTSFPLEKSILLNEPRGYSEMSGCIILPSEKAHFGLIFFNHEQYVSFKSSGLVATLTALLETGNLAKEPDEIYTIETTNGVYKLKAKMENNEVTSVKFNQSNYTVQAMPSYEKVTFDEKRSYLLMDLPADIPQISVNELAEINAWTKHAVGILKEHADVAGLIVVDQQTDQKVRSMTIKRDGAILRSPGFDSTFAILISLRKKDSTVSKVINESIFNSELRATYDSEEDSLNIVVESFVTGIHEFLVDSDDPLQKGFLLK